MAVKLLNYLIDLEYRPFDNVIKPEQGGFNMDINDRNHCDYCNHSVPKDGCKGDYCENLVEIRKRIEQIKTK